ncbi:BTB/POZ-like protein [Corchorus capsularis]|uniref:BTB/POZ-like protein n=1 Tax=Corchorus capsularis TaxID=210143 RepID=A0A1R3IC23_COCAP|nr:BTB/POZ-like protein [Corchorus capsularis]
MVDSKVETISRLAQWRIDNFGPCTYKKSDPFKVGLWNWHLSIEKNRVFYIRLFPEPSRVSKEQPPFVKFIIRVSNAVANRRIYISPVFERPLRTCDDFIWSVDSTFLGRFIIDVEFLDVKIFPLNGGEPISIWPMDGAMESAQSTLHCLARMLHEGIHADVTINTADGTLKAHKAVLSASSPVFESMFHHDLKEKESSTIHIEDMSLESCMAFLSYLYGTIKQEDFWKHRLALLGAANKYDIVDLKDACEDSLLEDINSQNVLERLQESWLYQLNRLKKGCMTYLIDFGKIYDVRDEINNFFRHADRELMLEMFQEVLTVWKPGAARGSIIYW